MSHWRTSNNTYGNWYALNSNVILPRVYGVTRLPRVYGVTRLPRLSTVTRLSRVSSVSTLPSIESEVDTFEYYNSLDPEIDTPLSIKTLRTISAISINENENDFCCICQESINKEIVRKLTCNHQFHIDCIEHWFEKRNNCPLCNTFYE